MTPLTEKAAPSGQPRRVWTPRMVFVLAFVLVLVVGRFYQAARVPVDDAFITFRYAENLVRDGCLCFNPGDKVEGYTSFGQLLLTAPATLVGKTFVQVWAVLLGLLAWAGVVALVWRRIHLTRGPRAPGYPEWLAILVLALCTPGVMWANSGMETALFALAWVAAWSLHLSEQEREAWPWASGLAVFAAGLLHPEGVLVGVVLGASWLVPFSKKRLARAAMFGAVAWGLFGLYWLWRWNYFGFLMPNTYYAKVGGGGALLRSGALYLWRSSLSMLTPFALVALAAWRVKTWRQWPRWLVTALALVAMLFAYLLKVGGDYFAFQRFLLPGVPFLVLGVWYFWFGPVSKRDQWEESRRPVLWAAVTLFGLVTWSNLMPPGHMLQHRLLQRTIPEYIAAGKMLREAVPEKATVATIPIGALGLYSERKILDLVGLTDLHLAHLAIDTGRRVVGHEKYDYGYVLEQQPEVILQLPVLFARGETGLRQWLQKTTLNTQQYTIYQYRELPENYELCWHAVEKPQPLRRGQAPAVGVYAYLRKDVVEARGYKSWVRLAEPLRRFPFTEWKRAVKANREFFGTRGLGMWTFSHEDVGAAPPPPPATPEQVWPPKPTDEPKPPST
jgi:arabinofuranosyltransferase